MGLYSDLKAKEYLTNQDIEEMYLKENVSVCFKDDVLNQEYRYLQKIYDIFHNLDVAFKREKTYDLYDDFYKEWGNSKLGYDDLEEILEKLRVKETNIKTSKLDHESDAYRQLKDEWFDIKYEFREAVQRHQKPINDKLDEYLLHAKRGVNRQFPSQDLIKKVVDGSLDIALYHANQNRKYLDWDFTFDDLFQTASLALTNAAKNYIPNGPAKFRTYANVCVEKSILNQVSKTIKKKYKGDFFKDEIDKAILVYKFVESFNHCGPDMSFYDCYLILKEYNRKRTRTYDSLLPTFSRKNYTPDKAYDLYKNLYSSLAINTILDDEDYRAIYDFMIKPYKRSKKNKIKYYRNDSFFIQEHVLLIYITKLAVIRELIAFEKEYKKTHEGLVPTFEEQYEHIKKFFNEYAKVKQSSKRYYYLRNKTSTLSLYDFTTLYQKEYDIFLLFEEEKEEEYAKVEDDMWDVLMDMSDVIERYDDAVKELEDLCNEDYDLDELGYTEEEYQEETQYYKNLYQRDLEDCEENAKSIFENINAKLFLGEYSQNDSYVTLCRKFLAKYKNEDDNIDECVKTAIAARRKKISDKMKVLNKELVEKNRAITKYADALFVDRKRITLDEFKGMQQALINLHSIDEGIDSDEKAISRNCRPSVEDEAENNLFFEEFDKFCNEELTLEERQVIDLYYDELGYRDNMPQAISLKLGMPKKDVEKYRQSAINKIKKSKLKEYLD